MKGYTNKINDIYHFIFHNCFIFYLFIIYPDIYIRKKLLEESTHHIVIASKYKNWNDAKNQVLGLRMNLDFFSLMPKRLFFNFNIFEDSSIFFSVSLSFIKWKLLISKQGPVITVKHPCISSANQDHRTTFPDLSFIDICIMLSVPFSKEKISILWFFYFFSVFWMAKFGSQNANF